MHACLNVFCSLYFTGYWHQIQHHAHALTRTPALKNLQIPIFLGKIGIVPFLTVSRQISPTEEININLTEGSSHKSVQHTCRLDLARPLDALDGRIYAAICGLWDAGVKITPNAIHTATGATRPLDSVQREKIIESGRALLGSSIEWKGERIPFLTGSFVHRENDRDSVTGHYNGSSFVIDDTPGLYKYVTDTDRYVTTMPVEYLCLSGNRTELAIAIQTYALERIAQNRYRGKKSVKITFESLFERLAISSRLARELHMPHHSASSKRRRARGVLLSAGADLVKNGAAASCNPYPMKENKTASTPVITVNGPNETDDRPTAILGIHLRFRGSM